MGEDNLYYEDEYEPGRKPRGELQGGLWSHGEFLDFLASQSTIGDATADLRNWLGQLSAQWAGHLQVWYPAAIMVVEEWGLRVDTSKLTLRQADETSGLPENLAFYALLHSGTEITVPLLR